MEIPNKPVVHEWIMERLAAEEKRGIDPTVNLYEAVELTGRAAALDYTNMGDGDISRTIADSAARDYAHAAALLARSVSTDKWPPESAINVGYTALESIARDLPKEEFRQEMGNREMRPTICVASVAGAATTSINYRETPIVSCVSAIATLIFAALILAEGEK